MSGKLVDIQNKRYGRLVVKQVSSKRALHGSTIWLCVCDCGNFREVRSDRLKDGTTKSCGCFKTEVSSGLSNYKHGMYGTSLYFIWVSMKQRCYNKNNKSYKDYGGRGIIVCKRWLRSFENFHNDMFAGYVKGLTLERINNNGNYTLNNCRWANREDQAINRRNTIIVKYGDEEKSLIEWAVTLNINYNILYYRYKNGTPIKK